MNSTDLAGYLAATLTTIAFVPQAWRTIRTRRTKDISLGMYAIFTAGVLCWLIYGILLDSPPIIVANTVTILLCATILSLKIRYR